MTLIVQVDDYDHKYLSADFAEDIGAKVEHLKFKSDLEISLKKEKADLYIIDLSFKNTSSSSMPLEDIGIDAIDLIRQTYSDAQIIIYSDKLVKGPKWVNDYNTMRKKNSLEPDVYFVSSRGGNSGLKEKVKEILT
jgi:hypothetical protein